MNKRNFSFFNFNKSNYKNAIYLYTLQITLVISNFVTIYFISNNYSPEIYATYTTNKSLAVLFAIIGSMGISFVSIKLLSIPKTNEGEIISSSLKVQFKYVFISFAILIFFVLFFEFNLFFALGFFLTYVLIEVRNILYSTFHAKSNFSFTSIVGIVSVVAYTAGCILLAINNYSIVYIVIFQLIVVLLSNLFVLKKVDINLLESYSVDSKNKIKNESKKMVFTSASLIIISEIEIVFLSFFTNGKTLGLLALTRRLLEIGSQTFASILDIAYPKLVKDINALSKINKYIYLVASLLFLVPIVLFLELNFLENIIRYFIGEEFKEVLKFLPGAFVSLPFMFKMRANIIIARSLNMEKKISFYILVSSLIILSLYFYNYKYQILAFHLIFPLSQISYFLFTQASIYKKI